MIYTSDGETYEDELSLAHGVQKEEKPITNSPPKTGGASKADEFAEEGSVAWNNYYKNFKLNPENLDPNAAGEIEDRRNDPEYHSMLNRDMQLLDSWHRYQQYFDEANKQIPDKLSTEAGVKDLPKAFKEAEEFSKNQRELKNAYDNLKIGLKAKEFQSRLEANRQYNEKFLKELYKTNKEYYKPK